MAKADQLTIWVRAYGHSVKGEMAPFIDKLLKELPNLLNSRVLICTNENDLILNELRQIAIQQKQCEVITSKADSYQQALTSLALQTHPNSNVLTLSVGIHIRHDQIVTGLNKLTDNVKVYGWRIHGQGNDGSCPGKGWYNTAALLDTSVVQLMSSVIPEWVDNDVLKNLDGYIIGGNEEIPIMVNILQNDKNAQFILNTHDPVFSSIQIGNKVNFFEKIERKSIVAQMYMKKMHRDFKIKSNFEDWVQQIWNSLKIESFQPT